MPAELLETNITMRMSVSEFRTLEKLLGLMPGAKPRMSFAIDSTRFSDTEWPTLGRIYAEMGKLKIK